MVLASAPSGANTSSRELIDPDPYAARFAAAGRAGARNAALVARCAHGYRAKQEPFAEAPARPGLDTLRGRSAFALLRNLDIHPVAYDARNHVEAARQLLYRR